MGFKHGIFFDEEVDDKAKLPDVSFLASTAHPVSTPKTTNNSEKVAVLPEVKFLEPTNDKATNNEPANDNTSAEKTASQKVPTLPEVKFLEPVDDKTTINNTSVEKNTTPNAAVLPNVKISDTNNVVTTTQIKTDDIKAKSPNVKFVGDSSHVNTTGNSNTNSAKLKKNKLFITIGLIIIGVIFVIWLIIKIVLLSMYNKIVDYDNFLEGLNKKSTYTYASEFITEDYLEYEGIRFKNNIDDNFVESSFENGNAGKGISYINENYKSSLVVGKEYTYIRMYESFFDYFSDEDDMWDFFTSEKFRKNYIKKSNVENDFEFFELVKEVNETKVSIFTPINKLRRMGSLKLFASVAFPSIDEIVVLAGEYDGYVFINDDYKGINIEHGKERYFISLNGEYFNEDMYLDILNTITIE